MAQAGLESVITIPSKVHPSPMTCFIENKECQNVALENMILANESQMSLS